MGEMDFTKVATGVEIEYMESDGEMLPGFEFEGERHPLNQVVRCHDNPWVSDVFPSFIHGYSEMTYLCPLFVSIVNGGDAVDLYRYAD